MSSNTLDKIYNAMADLSPNQYEKLKQSWPVEIEAFESCNEAQLDPDILDGLLLEILIIE